jgi:hypothetical protein
LVAVGSGIPDKFYQGFGHSVDIFDLTPACSLLLLLDWTGLDWTGLDWTGLGFSQAGLY